ncbi:hypothetical protein PV08_00687 [Exophiala spinifera]|uniref:Uncharacterized protein n=1 Tax=Exophiala spinifera TaxID=91928 RepID=A0A0D2A5R6_9EURO|nr:uncharacterized protein PV08_00687 [Exophiala spinifera]KIW20112.1 hypothetical protein PV08_00687 [Exophiala spinifera]
MSPESFVTSRVLQDWATNALLQGIESFSPNSKKQCYSLDDLKALAQDRQLSSASHDPCEGQTSHIRPARRGLESSHHATEYQVREKVAGLPHKYQQRHFQAPYLTMKNDNLKPSAQKLSPTNIQGPKQRPQSVHPEPNTIGNNGQPDPSNLTVGPEYSHYWPSPGPNETLGTANDLERDWLRQPQVTDSNDQDWALGEQSFLQTTYDDTHDSQGFDNATLIADIVSQDSQVMSDGLDEFDLQLMQTDPINFPPLETLCTSNWQHQAGGQQEKKNNREFLINMKRVIRYLQDQAVKASDQKYSGSAYLSPSTKEPQQRIRHHSPSRHKDKDIATNNPIHHHHHNPQSRLDKSGTEAAGPERGLSTTTTVVDGGGAARVPDETLISRNVTRHQYAQDSILQSYDVYIPDHDHERERDQRRGSGGGGGGGAQTTDRKGEEGEEEETEENGSRQSGKDKKFWVLFIHGGYFRDTNVTSASLVPALSRIVSSSTSTSTWSSVAGYASINYRLSPNPHYPQDPTKTPRYELRDAKWPDHMHDVLAAIAHLQGRYGFGDRYLLVGHSVGATMALLSTLSSFPYLFSSSTPASGSGVMMMTKKKKKEEEEKTKLTISPPLAVLGVSGIYDFPALHARFPSYVDLTRNANISTVQDDAAASPARYDVRRYETEWASNVPGGKVGVVLAHSRDDGLVDWGQVEIMRDVLLTGARIIDGSPGASSTSHGAVVKSQIDILPGSAGTSPGGRGEVRDGKEEAGEADRPGRPDGEDRKDRGNNNKQGPDHRDAEDVKDVNDIEDGKNAFGSKPQRQSLHGAKVQVKVLEIHGQHDRIWSEGTELARAIREGVEMMKRLSEEKWSSPP